MAQISGQAGSNLTEELASYLSSSDANIASEELVNIINQYLTGNDKVSTSSVGVSNGIYKRFGQYDKITGKNEVVTTGLWSEGAGSLGSLHKLPTQSASDYYTNAYSTDPTDATFGHLAEVQFAVTYGHIDGLGSVSLANDDNATLPTKATYAQYRSILLEQNADKFMFSSADGSGYASDSIYVINVNRARYREAMDPGNIQFKLTGSLGEKKFIDDSGKKFSDFVGKAGRVFNIVEGDLNLGTESESTITNAYDSNNNGFGLFYPDLGIIVLNPSAIADKVGLIGGESLVGDLGTDANKKNHNLLYDAINAGGDFEARRTENISTAHYFVRATNREFNYSNNPTYTNALDGTFTEKSFELDPLTFITTVGLYSDMNELLAVDKTSQPIRKSFAQELLLKVKLSF